MIYYLCRYILRVGIIILVLSGQLCPVHGDFFRKIQGDSDAARPDESDPNDPNRVIRVPNNDLFAFLA
jgi:hypothetical protein